MKIGDEVYVHGYVEEMRNDAIIIRNEGGYFGTEPCEVEKKSDNPQYANGWLDALNEIMKYSYGMLDAEKLGLQHKIQSMIWDFMGDKIADTPQADEIGDCNICRFAGCSECDDCINGSEWVRETEIDDLD